MVHWDISTLDFGRRTFVVIYFGTVIGLKLQLHLAVAQLTGSLFPTNTVPCRMLIQPTEHRPGLGCPWTVLSRIMPLRL